MTDYLATKPFDIYALHLFQQVVRHRSITRAAELVGLTQSAVTRQIQAIERSLGLELIERTTRQIRVTPAGEFLFSESLRLLGDVDSILQRLREDYGAARKRIRVGVSQSIGLAYLPGFFHANLKRMPQTNCSMSYLVEDDVLTKLQANELDLGVLPLAGRMPANLVVTHQFQDMFCLIAPVTEPATFGRKDFPKWAANQNWLLPGEGSIAGNELRLWFGRQGWKIVPGMESNSFDLIINLVSLGMGVGFVPVRALALYPQKKNLQRIILPVRYEREIAVVSRRRRKTPEHLAGFIRNILF